jgi:hypothetical protein
MAAQPSQEHGQAVQIEENRKDENGQSQPQSKHIITNHHHQIAMNRLPNWDFMS